MDLERDSMRRGMNLGGLSKRLLLTLTKLGLIGSTMLLLSSCGTTVIPSRIVPHRLASDQTIVILARNPEDGRYYPVSATFPAGSWVAFPELVER